MIFFSFCLTRIWLFNNYLQHCTSRRVAVLRDEMINHWNKTLDFLKEELSEKNFSTWIKPIVFNECVNGKLRLDVPNKFYKDWLDEHYRAVIIKNFQKVSKENHLLLEFSFAPVTPEAIQIQNVSHDKNFVDVTAKNGFLDNGSNEIFSKYRFDTFVVGPSNQFACAATKAVADNPGTVYNPLFIYGGAGLGKTHLLIAIRNIINASNRNLRVLYRTSERFTNEWINSIHKGKTQEFRARYRDNCDILLLDDVQFLAGKEQTQVEFFHTFNTLYSARKQIVITSDKYPKEIPLLDDRLKSRLEWGLICDIQPPELETRVAILKRKAEIENVNLPDDVALFVATNLKANVRLLEGSLTKLKAFSQLTGQHITLELAKDIFKSFSSQDKPITIDRIQDAVSSFFNIKPADLKSANRQKVFAFPRQIAMYLCRKLTKSSFPEIGLRFGGKDHSTIVHAAKKMENAQQKDPSLKVTIDSIEKTLLLRD